MIDRFSIEKLVDAHAAEAVKMAAEERRATSAMADRPRTDRPKTDQPGTRPGRLLRLAARAWLG
jgi:hypothetical protein